METEALRRLEAHMARVRSARGIRLAMDLAPWERALEATRRLGERWEYLGADGRWHKYWRRNGSVPDAAIRERTTDA